MESNKNRFQNLASLKSGVIFGAEAPEKNEIRVGSMVSTLKSAAKFLKWSGLVMIVISVWGLVWIYIPLGREELKYAWINSDTGKEVKSLKAVSQNLIRIVPITPDPEKPDWEVPDENYSVYIPKIGAISKVIDNVDADKPAEYLAALKKGVAEAAGLSHPGLPGTTYLFAHSVGSRVDFARYNAVFYLLHKLETGDEVEVVYRGQLYKYQVTAKEIVETNDTRYLVPQTDSERLILQTCYPPGTSWKRLIIVAQRE